ncbi:signal peptidase II [Streptomyces chartreusis]|uniref:signal peptidase II n=1 Tax=Streptomyces chartreusis TaxID=1969 RepID=UPI003427CE36
MSVVALLGSAAAVVVIDQASKAMAQWRLGDAPLRIGPGVWLVLVRNERVGLTGMSARSAMGLCAVASTTAMLILALHGPFAFTTNVGLGSAVGGATGNLFDRWRHGVVLDFIKCGEWPTFNVADAALCAGVALTVGSLL